MTLETLKLECDTQHADMKQVSNVLENLQHEMVVLKAAMKMEHITMEKKFKEAERKAKENFDKESRERGVAFEQERKDLKTVLDKEQVERKTLDEEVQEVLNKTKKELEPVWEALNKMKKELEHEHEEQLQFEASASELSFALQHVVLNQVCDCGALHSYWNRVWSTPWKEAREQGISHLVE